MGLFHYTYKLIAKNTTKYYLELKKNYADRFNNDISLLATAGVLDAKAYVFLEKTISINELLHFAKISFKKPLDIRSRKNIALLSFIVELETEVFSIEKGLDFFDIRPKVMRKLKVIEKAVLKTQGKYDKDPRISADVFLFMTDPNNSSYWNELGIKKLSY